MNSVKQQVTAFLVREKRTTRAEIVAAIPGLRAGTLCGILTELRKAGVITWSGAYHNRDIRLLKAPVRRPETLQDRLLRTIVEFGGSANFGQLKTAMDITANLLAATIAVAVKAGKVIKAGERRSYRYSVAGGIEVPRPKRMRLVTSVFDMGAAHG